jgi:trehalose 6-phosphate synthase/phosphatase
MIQITTPDVSKQVPSKTELKVSEIVSRINGKYGSLEFLPVHHFHQHIEDDEYFALLAIADVGLITSLRDGMNITAHEMVVCQQENHGTLILSEFTGTAHSMSAAILVNPWDKTCVSNAIYEALNMPKIERIMRHKVIV